MRELPLLLPDWPAPVNVRAAITTRIGGVSRGPWSSLNMGANTGDDPGSVSANRRRVQARLGLGREPAWLRQVHGNAVVRAEHAGNEANEADASWTTNPGVACVVLTADCLPILFCDRSGTRVAAVHGGWRGLAADIIGSTLLQMETPAGELMAWMGPAIGPDAFEVGPEVREAFVSRWSEMREAFRPGQKDRWFCDIRLLAGVRLRALGVTQIYGGDGCTHADAEHFYSFRRDGETGRMASFVWLAHEAVAE